MSSQEGLRRRGVRKFHPIAPVPTDIGASISESSLVNSIPKGVNEYPPEVRKYIQYIDRFDTLSLSEKTALLTSCVYYFGIGKRTLPSMRVVAHTLAIDIQQVEKDMLRIETPSPLYVQWEKLEERIRRDRMEEKIARLRKEGHHDAIIAAEVGVTIWSEKRVVRRLLQRGVVEPGRRIGEEKDKFDERVAELRRKGIQNDEIAQFLHVSLRTVMRSVARLTDAGKILSKMPSAEDITKFDAEVEQLIRRGFSNSMIAKILAESHTKIVHSAQRLREAGRITFRSTSRSIIDVEETGENK